MYFPFLAEARTITTTPHDAILARCIYPYEEPLTDTSPNPRHLGIPQASQAHENTQDEEDGDFGHGKPHRALDLDVFVPGNTAHNANLAT